MQTSKSVGASKKGGGHDFLLKFSGGETLEETMVLVPYRVWTYISTAISGGVDLSEVPGCHLLPQLSFQ